MFILDLIKRLRLFIYNRRNHTNIHSTKASLNACYDHDVMISENVIVNDNVTIGKYSYINRNSSVENCIIGNYCSISSGVWICPYEHHIMTKSSHPFVSNSLSELRKQVVIGNDVLVSLNAIILSGVHIGDGAIIAAGAVVTKDVLPYSIVGGVPAKVIRKRFSDDEIISIRETLWWEKDIPEIKNNTKLYNFLRNE